jgi:glycerol-3-phosphate dehydrogenase
MERTNTWGLPFSVAFRDHALDYAERHVFDLVVIGGGITGAGVLLDAASRGLSVLLLEKNDFASGTSSRSSRLIHGGLRYLEHYDFAVVSESLDERSVLLKQAPHLVWASPFVIPIFKHSFFAKRRHMLRAGLALYDAMGASFGSTRHRRLDRSQLATLIPGVDENLYDEGIVYWDAVNDDARTCISVLKTAVFWGGIAINYCSAQEAAETPNGVEISACDLLGGSQITVRARALVNATGVFADQVGRQLGLGIYLPLRPARGAHLVLKKAAYTGEAAVLLPVDEDQRFLFVIPAGEGVIVGTTDTAYEGSLDDPSPDPAEIRYIQRTFDRWSVRKLGPSDVSGSYAGLRPLVARDGAKSTSDISRRHVTVVGAKRSVTITGGKFTAYRKMAQGAVDLVGSAILSRPIPPSRTRRISLAGSCSLPLLEQVSAQVHRFVPERGLRSLWRRYGLEAIHVLRYQREFGFRDDDSPERPWCFEGQVLYALRHESAALLEDILFRRLRIGSDDYATAVELAPVVSSIARSELSEPSDAALGSEAVRRVGDYIKSRRDHVVRALL